MKNQALSFLAILLVSIFFTSYISAEPTSNINESNPAYSTVLEMGDNYYPEIDTIIEVCPPPPYVSIIPAGANLIGTDTIQVCIYDTIKIILGPNYRYTWDDNSSSQSHQFYTTGLGYDIQTHWVIAKEMESECVDTAQITVHFTSAACVTGFSEIENKSFGKIYPNPGNGLFNLPVKDIDGDAKLEVLGVNGQLKYQENINNVSDGSVQPIDLRGFSNGIFFVRVITADYIHIEKIIKQ